MAQKFSNNLCVRPMQACVFIFTIFFLKLATVSSENILVYQVIGSHSTRISMWPLVEGLAAKGHNVTFVSPFGPNKSNLTINSYIPKKWSETLTSWDDVVKFYDIRKNKEMIKWWFEFPNTGLFACEAVYSDPDFVDWIKSSTFDLIIMEASANECAYGMAHYWKAKIITYSTNTLMPWFPDAHGLPDEASSLSEMIFNFPEGQEMAFWQRFVNSISPIVWTIRREYSYFPKLEEITRKGLGLKEMPSFREIDKNVSLVMLSTHFSFEAPRSLPPNVISVGGLVLSEKKEALPTEIEKFINKGKDGFIYISFGTCTEFTQFDRAVQQEFIGALHKHPNIQFIWKSTNQIQFPLPDNVLVTKWVAQQSLLAHPKIKGFITHAGMGSTTEAIHYGVPLICLPVLVDQDWNAHTVASKGAAITLEVLTLKQAELDNAISEVLNNPKYKNAMKALSAVFKDRQQTPLENAIWWTEYVLRHDHGFLLPPGRLQSWWVKRQIDVWITAFLSVLVLTIIAAYICIRVVKDVSALLSNVGVVDMTKSKSE